MKGGRWDWILHSCFSDISIMKHFVRILVNGNIFSVQSFSDFELKSSESVFKLFPVFKDLKKKKHTGKSKIRMTKCPISRSINEEFILWVLLEWSGYLPSPHCHLPSLMLVLKPCFCY